MSTNGLEQTGTGDTKERDPFKLKLSLDERAQNLSIRLREYRSKHRPWSTPNKLDTLFDRLGRYIHEGPGSPGTNTPIKWLEEYTQGEEMIAADREEVVRKSEYEHDSVLGRLERARDSKDLETIAQTLDEIETAFVRLEIESPGETTEI